MFDDFFFYGQYFYGEDFYFDDDYELFAEASYLDHFLDYDYLRRIFIMVGRFGRTRNYIVARAIADLRSADMAAQAIASLLECFLRRFYCDVFILRVTRCRAS